jgi:[methyl-Co(III) methanol-specific corrinoid protein]:coenzyme M methyltransferase
MESSIREKMLRMLDGERTGEVFCSSNLSVYTWEQMGIVNAFYPEAHSDPDVMVRLAESQHTVLGFQSVRTGFCTTVEAEAFGAQVIMGDKESLPYVVKPAFNEPDAFIVPSNLFTLGRFPVQFKALSRLVEKYGNIIPVYGLVVGPLSILGHLFGVEKVMRWSGREQALFRELLEKVSDVVASYGNELIKRGADVIQMADPTASGSLVSPRVFKQFLVPIYKKLRGAIKGRVILHICGDTTLFLESILDTGFCGFSFEGPTVSVKQVKEVFGNRMALFGNIPTIDVLVNGTVDDVRKATMTAIEEGINSVAPACGMPTQTPLVNAKAMPDTVGDFNKKMGFA